MESITDDQVLRDPAIMEFPCRVVRRDAKNNVIGCFKTFKAPQDTRRTMCDDCIVRHQTSGKKS